MNRNHPYFNKKNTMVESTAPMQENFGALPHPVSHANNFAPIPIRNYEPVVVHPNSPSWNENHDVLPFMDAVHKKLNCYNYEMGGYHIDGQGLVYPISITEEANNGIISAIAYAIDNDPDESMGMMSAATSIINTEDAGLRYVCCTEDGKVHDIGPVNHVCIIGNLKRPEGLYIPMSNTKAMADGAIILDEIIAMATEDDRDLYDYEDVTDEYVAISDANVPTYKDDHACSCGNSCKCDGKCGKNCKCKSGKK